MNWYEIASVYLMWYMIVGAIVVMICIAFYGIDSIWDEKDSKMKMVFEFIAYSALWFVIAYIWVRDAIEFVHNWMKGGDDE